MATEDVVLEELSKLSLNALSGSEVVQCIKLKTRVNDKTMLILIDSGSSHSFVSSQFVQLAALPTTPIPARTVKLANGELLTTTSMVRQLKWYCQG